MTDFLKKWGATMAEYIEREAAIKALKDNVTEMERHIYFGSNLGVPEDEIEDIVNEIPVADVEPVKHGHWIVTEYYNPSEFGEEKAYTFKCSECGNAYHSTMGMSYCMDCGAKMDGEEVQE